MKQTLILVIFCFLLAACSEDVQDILNPQGDSLSVGTTTYEERLVDPLVAASHGTAPDISIVWMLQGVNADQTIDQGLILTISVADGITGTFTGTDVAAVYMTGIKSNSETSLTIDPTQTNTITLTTNEAVGGKVSGNYDVAVCDLADCANTQQTLSGTFSATTENTSPPADFGL